MVNKLATYFMVMSGLVLLFYFSGLVTDTASSTLLTLLLAPENLQNVTLTTIILTSILGIGTAGGIILGFVSRNVELIAMTPIVIFLLSLIWDFLSVFNKIAATNRVVAVLFFAPLLVLGIIVVVEFWRGRD